MTLFLIMFPVIGAFVGLVVGNLLVYAYFTWRIKQEWGTWDWLWIFKGQG